MSWDSYRPQARRSREPGSRRDRLRPRPRPAGWRSERPRSRERRRAVACRAPRRSSPSRRPPQRPTARQARGDPARSAGTPRARTVLRAVAGSASARAPARIGGPGRTRAHRRRRSRPTAPRRGAPAPAAGPRQRPVRPPPYHRRRGRARRDRCPRRRREPRPQPRRPVPATAADPRRSAPHSRSCQSAARFIRIPEDAACGQPAASSPAKNSSAVRVLVCCSPERSIPCSLR